MATIPTAAVLTINKNQVLLVKHGAKAGHLTDVFGLPGGTLEPDETEIQCAFREFTEETGLSTTIENLIEFPNNFYSAEILKKDGSQHTYLWKVFLCTSFEGSLKNSDETKPVWVDIDKIDTLNLLPNVKDALFAGLKYLKLQ